MNILFVDDEPYVISDHRDALKKAGHELHWANDLAMAVDLLHASLEMGDTPRFDLVLIDLMLGGEIPTVLMDSYRRLREGSHNEGQALGQWLWQTWGARQQKGRPIHCYFSHVPQFYRLATAPADQEFLGPGEVLAADMKPLLLPTLLLSKNHVRPSKLPDKLNDVVKCWEPWQG